MREGSIVLPATGWEAYEIGPGTPWPKGSNRRCLSVGNDRLGVNMVTTVDWDILRVGLVSATHDGWAVAAGERAAGDGAPEVTFLSLHRGDAGVTVPAALVGERSWIAEAQGLQFDAVVAVLGKVTVGRAIPEPEF